MANTTSLRTSILASNLDEAVYVAGQPIYSVATYQGKSKVTVLPAAGKWVFYNPVTGLSTGTAATRSTVSNLKIGVALGPVPGGPATDIQWYNDGFNGCSMQNMNGQDSICGLPAITDALFGSCLECDRTYTIKVVVYDPETESFGQKDGSYNYYFSYTLPCGNCASSNCTEELPNADELMCGLYNKIYGIHNDPNWDITLNDLPIASDHEYRFNVSKLYKGTAADLSDDTTFEYCLSQSDTDCINCNQFTAIGGYSLNGGETEVTFSPATFSEVSEGVFASTRAQIDDALFQLKVGLAGNGDAVFLPAIGNCCTNHKLEVNTCLLDFQLLDAEGTPIASCNTSNPFAAITIYSECQDCDSENSTITPNRGLRFSSISIEGECDCLNGNRERAEHFSEIEVYFLGAWDIQAVKVSKVQRPTIAQGQGFQWQGRQIRELRDADGGPRFYDDNFGGNYGFPEKNDRLRHPSIVDCHDAFCVVGGTYASRAELTPLGQVQYVPQDIYALIPTDHTTAKASFLTAWNNFFAGGDCGLPTISCVAIER